MKPAWQQWPGRCLPWVALGCWTLAWTDIFLFFWRNPLSPFDLLPVLPEVFLIIPPASPLLVR